MTSNKIRYPNRVDLYRIVEVDDNRILVQITNSENEKVNCVLRFIQIKSDDCFFFCFKFLVSNSNQFNIVFSTIFIFVCHMYFEFSVNKYIKM